MRLSKLTFSKILFCMSADEEREALKEDLLDFISRFLRMVELELNFEFNRHGKIRGQMKGEAFLSVTLSLKCL